MFKNLKWALLSIITTLSMAAGGKTSGKTSGKTIGTLMDSWSDYGDNFAKLMGVVAAGVGIMLIVWGLIEGYQAYQGQNSQIKPKQYLTKLGFGGALLVAPTIALVSANSVVGESSTKSSATSTISGW